MARKIAEGAGRAYDIGTMGVGVALAGAYELVTGLSSIDPETGTRGRASIPTGFLNVDRCTLGLWPGELTVVAGPPGAGKSSFASTVALNAARSGARVLYVTLERSAASAAVRMIANQARVDLGKMLGGRLGEDDWGAIADASNEISRLDLLVHDGFFDTGADFRSLVEAASERAGGLLVVVDDVDLLERASLRGPWCAFLKEVARESGVAILAVCDSAEGRALPHGSGAADSVVLLERGPSDPAVVGALIAKHGLCAPTETRLCFLPQFSSFVDYAEEDRASRHGKGRVEELAANLGMGADEVADALDALCGDE